MLLFALSFSSFFLILPLYPIPLYSPLNPLAHIESSLTYPSKIYYVALSLVLVLSLSLGNVFCPFMPNTKKEGEDVLCKGHTFWELPLKIAKFASSNAALTSCCFWS